MAEPEERPSQGSMALRHCKHRGPLPIAAVPDVNPWSLLSTLVLMTTCTSTKAEVCRCSHMHITHMSICSDADLMLVIRLHLVVACESLV